MSFTVQRGILKGNIAGVVQTRNMFTAEVQYVEPDTPEFVWSSYITSILTPIHGVIAAVWHADSIQIDNWFGGHWEPQEDDAFSYSGIGAGEAVANLVAAVLIGKCLGRRRIGRKFISPIDEANASGNTIVGTGMTYLGQALLAYISPLTTSNGSILQPGILDKDGTFRMFFSGSVSQLLGTIRRRKPGRGV